MLEDSVAARLSDQSNLAKANNSNGLRWIYNESSTLTAAVKRLAKKPRLEREFATEGSRSPH